jgi:hypothetical protein
LATVEISPVAAEDLECLIATNKLPPDTSARLANSLRVLEAFPLAGAQLEGAWSDFRFWAGPWPWIIVVYEHEPDRNAVVVVAIHDGRGSEAATSER